jgi:hypothetical protein
MPEAVSAGHAFLWLVRRATDDQAREIIRQVLADPNERWSEIVEKNLAGYLKKPGE